MHKQTLRARAWTGRILSTLLITLAALPVYGQRQAVEQAWQYGQQALDAYEAGAYAAYLDNLRKAVDLRPNHPGLTYRLAGAYALTGQPDEAVAWLARYAAMGMTADPAGDDDFASVRDADGFADAVAQIERNARPVGRSAEAFRLSDPSFIPEGLAYDPAGDAFYVGSVRRRRIVRVDAEGREEAFTAAGQDGLWSVLGLAVDAPRRRLWVGSAALKQTQDLDAEEQGRSGLWRYDLDTGALARRYLLPPDDREHVLGDVTLNERGDVFATDAAAGALYVLRDGSGRLEAVLEPGTLVSPQGLCFVRDGAVLVVADYALGLLAVDPEARRASVFAPPGEVTLLGIDGLACYGDQVIAVQNGVRPHRVVRFVLNAAADGVERAEVLEANHPLFEEPTPGTVFGDAYFYVANSQWNRFDEEGALPDAAALRPPVILKLALEPDSP